MRQTPVPSLRWRSGRPSELGDGPRSGSACSTTGVVFPPAGVCSPNRERLFVTHPPRLLLAGRWCSFILQGHSAAAQRFP